MIYQQFVNMHIDYFNNVFHFSYAYMSCKHKLPGSRDRRKKRKQVRYVVGRLCRKCISCSLLRVKGQKLFKRIRRKSGPEKVSVYREKMAA